MKFSQLIILALLPAMVLVPGAHSQNSIILIDDFESGIKAGWERKDFKGRTLYTVIKDGNGQVLKAVSNASATVLIYRYRYDVREYPILSWRWKVENIIQRGDATKKDGDDYPARVYVIFPHWIPFMTKSLNYIWSNRLPEGSRIPNTYYSKSIMISVEQGPVNVGKWITEKRNVYEDYRKAFGKEPPEAGGIAIMTDTDQTGESAVAYYDEIKIEKIP